jgi:hypothetical protein
VPDTEATLVFKAELPLAVSARFVAVTVEFGFVDVMVPLTAESATSPAAMVRPAVPNVMPPVLAVIVIFLPGPNDSTSPLIVTLEPTSVMLPFVLSDVTVSGTPEVPSTMSALLPLKFGSTSTN